MFTIIENKENDSRHYPYCSMNYEIPTIALKADRFGLSDTTAATMAKQHLLTMTYL